jgi:hypothetical protein
MQTIIAFAIFSTHCEGEITRLAWADLDADGSRIMVRDMKHPGDKTGQRSVVRTDTRGTEDHPMAVENRRPHIPLLD